MPKNQDKSDCKLCGGQSHKVRVFDKAHSIFLRRCKKCQAEFLWPQPTSEILSVEYKDYYTRRGSQGERAKANHFRRLLPSLKIDFNKGKTLEIGSAEGDAISVLKEIWPASSVAAVESNADSSEFLKTLGCQVYMKPLEAWLKSSGDEKFNQVLMFDLLEHLADPSESLRLLVENHLAPGGVIAATFPNSTSLSRHAFGRLWPQYKLEHLFYFSDSALKNVESDLNMERLYLRPLKKNLPVKYLLNVGRNFGPGLTKKIFSILHKIVPPKWGNSNLSLGFGELLWVAKKKS